MEWLEEHVENKEEMGFISVKRTHARQRKEVVQS